MGRTSAAQPVFREGDLAAGPVREIPPQDAAERIRKAIAHSQKARSNRNGNCCRPLTVQMGTRRA